MSASSCLDTPLRQLLKPRNSRFRDDASLLLKQQSEKKRILHPTAMVPRLLALAAAVAAVSGQYSLPPALQGAQNSASSSSIVVPDHKSDFTDSHSIAETASVVEQKTGVPAPDTLPGLPQAPTKLTALDGELLVSDIPDAAGGASGFGRRAPADYDLVFGPAQGSAPDAAVEGTAYLSFFLVNNATDEIARNECFARCDDTPGCVFLNMYRELHNRWLDFVFPEQSNMRCVLYGDVHTAAEKTNFGGIDQHDTLLPSLRIAIQDSVGYALSSVDQPVEPEGYKLVFGPLSAANNAPGYMGFAFIDKYDVAACAALCNTRGADPVGGACKFFNIWTALVHGHPQTYTCAMYTAPTNDSTATNAGQGDLKVSMSRGYARQSYIPNGDFESYACADGGDFCFAETALGWVGSSPKGGHFDASVFHYAPYAHSGSSVALLGCAFGSDPYPGLLRPAAAIAGLKSGRSYVLGFFYSSAYSGKDLEKNAFVSVWWGGAFVGNVTPGYTDWTYTEFRVVAGKNNTLAFIGGQAPAYSFVDDVSLFAL
ncbi:hypothetical protein MKEN_01087100 [Mycena kentingensis (nom. inval.)]|nr:hypothetical protein MKEN_01087100 [Mycena kentingensis (nom. inval.)]